MRRGLRSRVSVLLAAAMTLSMYQPVMAQPVEPETDLIAESAVDTEADLVTDTTPEAEAVQEAETGSILEDTATTAAEPAPDSEPMLAAEPARNIKPDRVSEPIQEDLDVIPENGIRAGVSYINKKNFCYSIEVPKSLFGTGISDTSFARDDTDTDKPYKARISVYDPAHEAYTDNLKTSDFDIYVGDDVVTFAKDKPYIEGAEGKELPIVPGEYNQVYFELLSRNGISGNECILSDNSVKFSPVSSYYICVTVSGNEMSYRGNETPGVYLTPDLSIELRNGTIITKNNISLDGGLADLGEFAERWGWEPVEPHVGMKQYSALAYRFDNDDGSVYLDTDEVAFNITDPATGRNLLTPNEYFPNMKWREISSLGYWHLCELLSFDAIPADGFVNLNMAVATEDKDYYYDNDGSVSLEVTTPGTDPMAFSSTRIKILPSRLPVRAVSCTLSENHANFAYSNITVSTDASDLWFDPFSGEGVPEGFSSIEIDTSDAGLMSAFSVDGEPLDINKAYSPGVHELAVSDASPLANAASIRDFLDRYKGVELTADPTQVDFTVSESEYYDDSIDLILSGDAVFQYGTDIADTDTVKLDQYYKPAVVLSDDSIAGVPANMAYKFTKDEELINSIMTYAADGEIRKATTSFNAISADAIYNHKLGEGPVYVIARASINTTSGTVYKFAFRQMKLSKRPVTVSMGSYSVPFKRRQVPAERTMTLSGDVINKYFTVVPDTSQYPYHEGLGDVLKGTAALNMGKLTVDLAGVDFNTPGKYRLAPADDGLILSSGLAGSYELTDDSPGIYADVASVYYVDMHAVNGSRIYCDITAEKYGDKHPFIMDPGEGGIVSLNAILGKYNTTSLNGLLDPGQRLSAWSIDGVEVAPDSDFAFDTNRDYSISAVIENDLDNGKGYDGITVRTIEPVTFDTRQHVLEATDLKGNEKNKINDLKLQIYDRNRKDDSSPNGFYNLVFGTDFTASYKNNKAASVYYENGKVKQLNDSSRLKFRPQVIIRGKGDYKNFNITLYFDILPADISTLKMKVTGLENTYAANNKNNVSVKYTAYYTTCFKMDSTGTMKEYTFKLKENVFGYTSGPKAKDFNPVLYKWDDKKGWQRGNGVNGYFSSKNKVTINGAATYMLVLEGNGNYCGTYWPADGIFDKDIMADGKNQFYVVPKDDKDMLISNTKVSYKKSFKANEWTQKKVVSVNDLNLTVKKNTKDKTPLKLNENFEVEFVNLDGSAYGDGKSIKDGGKYWMRIKALATKDLPLYGFVDYKVVIVGEKIKAADFELEDTVSGSDIGKFKTGANLDYNGRSMNLKVVPKAGLTIMDYHNIDNAQALSHNSMPGKYSVVVNGKGIYGGNSVTLKFARKTVAISKAEKTLKLEPVKEPIEQNIYGALPDINVTFCGRKPYRVNLSNYITDRKASTGKFPIIDDAGNITYVYFAGKSNTKTGEATLTFSVDKVTFHGSVSKKFKIEPKKVSGVIRDISELRLSDNSVHPGDIFAEVSDVTNEKDLKKANVTLCQVNLNKTDFKTIGNVFDKSVDQSGTVSIYNKINSAYSFNDVTLATKVKICSSNAKLKLPKLKDIETEGNILNSSGQAYFTGRQVLPEIRSIKLDNGTRLESGKDYILYYGPNIASGDAKIYVKLLPDGPKTGGCGGMFTYSFKIIPKGDGNGDNARAIGQAEVN